MLVGSRWNRPFLLRRTSRLETFRSHVGYRPLSSGFLPKLSLRFNPTKAFIASGDGQLSPTADKRLTSVGTALESDFAALHQHFLLGGSSSVNPFTGHRDIRHFTAKESVMSSLVPEQLVATQKAGSDVIFGFLTKYLEGFEKLAELNLQAVKSTLSDNHDTITKVFSAKQPQEFVALQAGLAQPAAGKVQSYWRNVYEIISGSQAEFAAAAEAQLKQHQRDAQALLDGISKDAPTGYETALAAWKTFIKTAIEASSATYETARKAVKHAAEPAEGNASAAAPAPAPAPAPASAPQSGQAVVALEAAAK